MEHTKSFVISEFTNPSGEIVFRLSGSLDGKRIRKNFPTRPEAEAERQTLEIARLQAENFRTAITRLSDDQLKEAEAAFLRLTGQPQSLSFCVEFTLTNYRAPEKQKSLKEAVAEYCASKQHEHEQDLLSISQCARIGRDLKRLQESFPAATVAELTVPKLLAFLERGRPAFKTYNNRRGIVSTFLKFAFHRGWIAENPIAKVPHHRIRRRRGMAETLSAAKVRELMEHLEHFEEGRWVPYFALCLFAGIRPAVPHGEITRLKPADVCLKARVISISSTVSKVREPRSITIQPNLAAWLQAYPLEKFPLLVGDFQNRRLVISKKFGLSHDVMRHTFISMFVAKFRSLGEAALQAGNSESIIRRHYLALKSSAEAEEFFSIVPKHARVVSAPVLSDAA